VLVPLCRSALTSCSGAGDGSPQLGVPIDDVVFTAHRRAPAAVDAHDGSSVSQVRLLSPDDTGESDWLLDRFGTIEDLQREWEKEREEGG